MVAKKSQNGCHSVKSLRLLLGVFATIVLLYVASFLVVFDLAESAVSWDEENYGTHQVAIGPKPRTAFAHPSHWNIAYETRQWPFWVYRPLCELWLRAKGYVPPAEWR